MGILLATSTSMAARRRLAPCLPFLRFDLPSCALASFRVSIVGSAARKVHALRGHFTVRRYIVESASRRASNLRVPRSRCIAGSNTVLFSPTPGSCAFALSYYLHPVGCASFHAWRCLSRVLAAINHYICGRAGQQRTNGAYSGTAQASLPAGLCRCLPTLHTADPEICGCQ